MAKQLIFETAVRTILQEKDFFFFTGLSGHESAAKCVDNRKSVWISVVPYKPLGTLDMQAELALTGIVPVNLLQQVYWLQFRMNRKSAWQMMEFSDFYAFTAEEVASFLHNWRQQYDRCLIRQINEDTARYAVS